MNIEFMFGVGGFCYLRCINSFCNHWECYIDTFEAILSAYN